MEQCPARLLEQLRAFDVVLEEFGGLFEIPVGLRSERQRSRGAAGPDQRLASRRAQYGRILRLGVGADRLQVV